ncbi:hypothetical protein F2P81_021750 [Scophthalmus maximus]|uniref:Uncharacterized protein n=1 Tax=Scophthalmus maximus TaxID=52904 RepID=A0A6A4RY70_SCOMX|nr:hypothetical protein F2P81_021750 [Scophthalmus maximus]
MESRLLIGWQQENKELKREVCRVQEELAESRAERDELESRNRALNDRVIEYRDQCQRLELQLLDEQTHRLNTEGTFLLGELEQRTEEQQLHQEAEVSELKQRVVELSRSLQEEHSQREERERAVERHRETERRLQSVSRAVIRLSRVLSSSCQSVCVSSDSVLSLDLCSLLSVVSQAESALQRRHQELQSRERELRLSSSECVLTWEVDAGRDALDKMATLNVGLESDKREMNKQLLQSTETTEEEHLRRRVVELEQQVSQLRLSLTVDRQQRAEFIQQSSRNSQWLLSLRNDLSDSLAIVTHRPVPSVLESETQRLDRSLIEEELRMSLSQS